MTVKLGRRRSRLSREALLDAALDLIDREGLDALSTRALGREVGAEAMAIYHYFPSKDRLLDGVAERLVAEITVPQPGTDWRSAMRGCVLAYVERGTQHPRAISLLAGRRFNSPGTLPFFDAVLAILEGAGLEPRQSAKAFRMIGYFINGALLAHAATFDAGRRDDFRLEDTDFTRDWPRIAAVVPFLRNPLGDIFEDGLEALLEHVEQMRPRWAQSAQS